MLSVFDPRSPPYLGRRDAYSDQGCTKNMPRRKDGTRKAKMHKKTLRHIRAEKEREREGRERGGQQQRERSEGRRRARREKAKGQWRRKAEGEEAEPKRSEFHVRKPITRNRQANRHRSPKQDR